jgi:hypothetical protein
VVVAVVEIKIMDMVVAVVEQEDIENLLDHLLVILRHL